VFFSVILKEFNQQNCDSSRIHPESFQEGTLATLSDNLNHDDINRFAETVKDFAKKFF
jgi:hypothetical protein